MTTYLYIMKCASMYQKAIKIGVADNPEKRLAELQTGNPFRIDLMYKIPMKSRAHAFEIERKLHESYGKYRLMGEWFKGSVINRINVNKLLGIPVTEFVPRYNYDPELEKEYEGQLEILSEAKKHI